MDVRAIVVLGPVGDTAAPETIGGIPIGLLDVLGRPVLHRVADRLYRYAVSAVSVVGDAPAQHARIWRRALRPDLPWVPGAGAAAWRAAQQVFSDYVHGGADLVLVLRLGPYAEIDFEHLIQCHLDGNGRVTAVTDARGELLGTFVVSASRRNDAAFMLRHELKEFRGPILRYSFSGYLNRLESAADLRRLAVDSFCGNAQITPEGTEMKPGVWVARGARIHRGARVLAPAFIGERARVRASAVITRCSVLEHHAEVDCGTVVEDASLLPFTRVGAGLDVTHAVVGFNRLAHLRRHAEIEILDPKLVGTSAAAPLRALGSAASLASFVPVEFMRGLFGRRRASLPAAAQAPSPDRSAAALPAEAEQFPLMVARRYGNE